MSKKVFWLAGLTVGAAVALPAYGATELQAVEIFGDKDKEKGESSAPASVLKDTIVKTEVLDEKFIERTNASNLNEALDDNSPGIAVQVECSICNVRNVLLNNLPGRYTTLMVDGIPIFSSVSTAYGIDSISLAGVESIEVSRGAGASLIAPEALSGVVNIVTKRPTEQEGVVDIDFGEYQSRSALAYVASPFSGGAVNANLNYAKHATVDRDGNGISEYTGYERLLAGFGYFIDDLAGFKVKGRLDLVQEDRNGGALGDNTTSIIKSESGNPFDWSKGAHGSPSSEGWVNPSTGEIVIYDDGLGGMSEIIETDRQQLIVSGDRPLAGGKLRLAAGYARHKQDSYYEHSIYAAEQDQVYLEASYQKYLGGIAWNVGLNYRYEDLESYGATADGTSNDGIDNYVYRTPGLFLQGYRSFFDDRLEMNASVRYDQHNEFDGIVSPRLNMLYWHSDKVTSRVSLGKGYRAPTSFFEQDHGIIDTTRIVRDVDDPEESYNLSYALNYAGDRLSATFSANHNRIENMALLDSGAEDDQGNAITLFTNAENDVEVNGLDIVASYQWTPYFSTGVGFEQFFYSFDEGTLVFSRPEQKAYFSADLDVRGWDLFVRATWTGKQDLERFYGQQYHLDGTPIQSESPSFWVVDARAEYKFWKGTSLYVGVDNLFDYYQSDEESPLFIDEDGAIDVINIWGPSRGRYVYAGIRAEF